MTYKRKPQQSEMVELFNRFRNVCELIEAFDIDVEHFFDWLSVQVKAYIAEFGPVGFDETKRTFGEDMPRTVKKVTVEGETKDLLAKWWSLCPVLKKNKEDEHALRQTLVTRLFDAGKFSGTETVDIGEGWKLKATKPLNISATNKDSQMDKLLAAVWAIPEIQEIAQRVVSRWTPEISTPAYNDLVKASEKYPAIAALIVEVFTVKPGMPELEIVEPKAPIVVEDAPLPTADGGTLTTDGSKVTW